MRGRRIVDSLFFMVFLALMDYTHLPRAMHEVVGLGVLLLIGVHLYQNRAWFAGLARGRWTRLRVTMTVIDLLLLVGFLVVIVSGAALSRVVFAGVWSEAVRRSVLFHQLHIGLSWGLLILVGLHIGLHGRALWQSLLRALSIDAGSRRAVCASLVLQVFFAALGIYASFAHRVGDHLLLQRVHNAPAMSGGAAYALMLLLTIAGLYAVLGSLAARALRR